MAARGAGPRQSNLLGYFLSTLAASRVEELAGKVTQ